MLPFGNAIPVVPLIPCTLAKFILFSFAFVNKTVLSDNNSNGFIFLAASKNAQKLFGSWYTVKLASSNVVLESTKTLSVERATLSASI